MEHIDIQNLWKQSESLLEENRKLNTILLKEIKLDKVKSSLKSVLFLPITTLIFFSIVASYACYFAIIQSNIWYFAFSGWVVAFFGLWLVISSIKQLKLILSIDYTEPVIKLQKEMVQIKLAIIQNLRIAAWSLPFGPFIGIFFFKVLFNYDIMALVDYKMLISFGISTILLEVISLVLLKALRPKNRNKKWLNWILQSSGSQVNNALDFLRDIQNFEAKKA